MSLLLARRGVLAAAALLAGIRNARSQTAPDVPAAIATAPAPSATSDDVTIEDQVQAYIEDNGFGARARRNEIAVLKGYATVDVPSSDPRWIAFRTLAYEKALLEAQADFVLQMNNQITAETVSDTFKAAGQEPPEYKPADNDPSKLAELIRKLIALGSGKLDQALRELNIDPTAFERASEPQRFVQLRAALTVKGMEKAFGELGGLMPVQTFEKKYSGDDKGGNYKIAVFAVVSPRMKDFAQQVVRDRGRFPADPARAGKLTDLYADKSQLIRDFGIRLRYDEAGLPAIVSFYQWMSEYRGQDPITAERFRDIAFKQAEVQADRQIAVFLKGTVNVARTAELGSKIVQAADRLPDGYIAQQAETRDLVNAYQATIQQRAQIAMTGISTLSRWSFKHPDTGQEILGAIRIWSAASEQATRALRDRKAPPHPGGTAGATTGPAAGRTGRKLIDSTDF